MFPRCAASVGGSGRRWLWWRGSAGEGRRPPLVLRGLGAVKVRGQTAGGSTAAKGTSMVGRESGEAAPVWGTPSSMPLISVAPVLIVAGGSLVRALDLESGRLLYQPLDHGNDVNAVAVGRLHERPILVPGGDDRTVRVWDLHPGQPLGVPLAGHRRKVRAVAVGQLGGRPIAVSGSNDNT